MLAYSKQHKLLSVISLLLLSTVTITSIVSPSATAQPSNPSKSSPFILVVANGMAGPITSLSVGIPAGWQLNASSPSCGALGEASETPARLLCQHGALSSGQKATVNLGWLSTNATGEGTFTMLLNEEIAGTFQTSIGHATVSVFMNGTLANEGSNPVQVESTSASPGDAGSTRPSPSSTHIDPTGPFGPANFWPYAFYFPMMANASFIPYSTTGYGHYCCNEWVGPGSFQEYGFSSLNPSNNCANYTGCYQQVAENEGYDQWVGSKTEGQTSWRGFVEMNAAGPNNSTFSFQTSASNSNIDTHITFVDANHWSTANLPASSTTHYIDFCICGGYEQVTAPDVSVSVSSSTVSYYAAWAVRETLTGSYPNQEAGFQIYLNTGKGFQLFTTIAASTNLKWVPVDNFVVYLFGETTHVSTTNHASFGYLTVTYPNNPIAEATFDQNVWFLARHYEYLSNLQGGYSQITTGGRSYDPAMISDTSAPPLWINDSAGHTYYAGEALQNGPYETWVQSKVVSSSPTQERLDYTFYNQCALGLVSLCGDNIDVQVTQTQSGSSNIDTYNVTAVSVAGSRSYTVHLGANRLFTVTHSSAPKASTLAFANGLPGSRYVARHITYVAALLLHEIWYDGQWGTGPNMAAPLKAFINQTVSACYSAFLYPCSTPYLEYYSPMFYYYDTGSLIPDNWYASTNAFEPSSFYTQLPSTTSIIPNQLTTSGSGTSFTDAYISRLSIISPDPLSPGLTVNNLWLSGVMQYGYNPSALSLQAEHLLNRYGTTDLGLAEQDLTRVGWNSFGTSENVCLFTGGASNWPWPFCNTAPAYATYAAATFLSADSEAASVSHSVYQTWAQEAAGVLEAALWSGTGNIAGQSQPITLWQETGGELAAYSSSPQPIAYASNQGGVFGEVSNILQEFGIAGVQPAETPGFDVVDTEATGLSAAALFNYLSYLPGVQEIPTIAHSTTSGAIGDPTPSVSCTGTCPNTEAFTDSVSFNATSSSTFTATYSMPFTTSELTYPGTIQADFWANGTIGSGGSLQFFVKLIDQTSGATIASTSTTLSTAGNVNRLVSVITPYAAALNPGSYTLQYGFTGQGPATFYTNYVPDSPVVDYVQLVSSSVTPDSLHEAFTTDTSYANNWNTYSAGPVGSSSTSANSTNGLILSEKSTTQGTTAEYGLVTKPVYYFGQGSFSVMESGKTGSSTASACTAISPELASGGTAISSLNDFITACQNGPSQTASVNIRSGGGTASAFTATMSSTMKNATWMLTVAPSGNVSVSWNGAGNPLAPFGSIPRTQTVSWPKAQTFYIYDYQSTSTSSPTTITSAFVEGMSNPDPPSALLNDTWWTVGNVASASAYTDSLDNQCVGQKYTSQVSGPLPNYLSFTFNLQYTGAFTDQAGIYDSAGSLLASGSSTWSSLSAGNYNLNVYIANPPTVAAGQQYYLVVQTNVASYLGSSSSSQPAASTNGFTWGCSSGLPSTIPGSGTTSTGHSETIHYDSVAGFTDSSTSIYVDDYSGNPAPSLHVSVPSQTTAYVYSPTISLATQNPQLFLKFDSRNDIYCGSGWCAGVTGDVYIIDANTSMVLWSSTFQTCYGCSNPSQWFNNNNYGNLEPYLAGHAFVKIEFVSGQNTPVTLDLWLDNIVFTNYNSS